MGHTDETGSTGNAKTEEEKVPVCAECERGHAQPGAFTMCQFLRLCTKNPDKVYFLHDGGVHDAKFLVGHHPGKDKCLKKYRGTDIGAHMKFHSPGARSLLRGCKVGVPHASCAIC